MKWKLSFLIILFIIIPVSSNQSYWQEGENYDFSIIESRIINIENIESKEISKQSFIKDNLFTYTVLSINSSDQSVCVTPSSLFDTDEETCHNAIYFGFDDIHQLFFYNTYSLYDKTDEDQVYLVEGKPLHVKIFIEPNFDQINSLIKSFKPSTIYYSDTSTISLNNVILSANEFKFMGQNSFENGQNLLDTNKIWNIGFYYEDITADWILVIPDSNLNDNNKLQEINIKSWETEIEFGYTQNGVLSYYSSISTQVYNSETSKYNVTYQFSINNSNNLNSNRFDLSDLIVFNPFYSVIIGVLIILLIYMIKKNRHIIFSS